MISTLIAQSTAVRRSRTSAAVTASVQAVSCVQEQRA